MEYFIPGVIVLLLVIYLVKRGPVPFNNKEVGTTFYVFKCEDGIADLIPTENFRGKDTKWKQYILENSMNELDPGKTYTLEKNDKGFYMTQVCEMLEK